MQFAGEATPRLYPLTFIPGCNNDPDIIRAQLIENIKRDLPWLELSPAHDRALAIVGGGPSLAFELPGLLKLNADVLALNGSYGYLQAQGISPDYFMLLDTREENLAFLDAPCGHTRHFIAAQCHPAIFDRLQGFDTTLYLTTLPGVLDLVSHLDKPKHRLVGTAGTVGIKALSLAYALGYRQLHLYGYDSSYVEDAHHAYPQALNDDCKTMAVFLNGNEYLTTASMAHQAVEFLCMAHDMVHFHGFDIYLYGFGLLNDMVAEGNLRGEIPLEQREREKYERIWAVYRYREHAPGEDHVERARAHFFGQTVIDFGCGCGRAAQALRDRGHFVTGIDHAMNCLDPGTSFVFLQSCLWDLPAGLSCDWGFCTDVMEHIPTEKVPDVLAGIAVACRDGVYFNIATRPDVMGAAIGEKLHLTVMPASEWEKLLLRYWHQVVMTAREGEATFIVRNRGENV